MKITPTHREYVDKLYLECKKNGKCSNLKEFFRMFVSDPLAEATAGVYGSSWTGGNQAQRHRDTADAYLIDAWPRIQEMGLSLSIPFDGDHSTARSAVQAAPALPVQAKERQYVLSRLMLGVPGTGKTHRAIDDYASIKTTTFITMHAATSYEEFVEGLRPSASSDSDSGTDAHKKVYRKEEEVTSKTMLAVARVQGQFQVRDGAFLSACKEAALDPQHDHLVVLDEFNRCNVPKVMGELLSALEPSRRARWLQDRWQLSDALTVTLPYSQRLFFIPENLIVVATMNTSDRSIAPLDAAVLRRFAVERVWPLGFEHGQAWQPQSMPKGLMDSTALQWSVRVWSGLNRLLLDRYGPDAMVGHSYLLDMQKAVDGGDRRFYRPDGDQPLATVKWYWNHALLPQVADILESMNAFEEVGARGDGELGKALTGVFAPLAGLEVLVLGQNALQRRIQLRLK